VPTLSPSNAGKGVMTSSGIPKLCSDNEVGARLSGGTQVVPRDSNLGGGPILSSEASVEESSNPMVKFESLKQEPMVVALLAHRLQVA